MSKPTTPGDRPSVGRFGGRRRLTLAVTILAAAVAIGGAWQLLWPGPFRIDANDVTLVARGGEIYQAQCARCHGANLEGQPEWRVRKADGRLPAPPHDDSGHTWHHPDEQLFGLTKYGLGPYAPAGYESDMPAYEGVLTDNEIVAVLAFIKSRWSAEKRQRQQHLTEQSPP